MPPSQNRQITLLAILAFVIPLALYLIWRPYVYSGDDLQQTMVIQEHVSGQVYYHPAGGRLYEPGLTERVHEARSMPVNPRYLLEVPTSIVVARIADGLGWQGSVITPVLIFRAVVGSLGVLFLFLALYELRCSGTAALLGSLGLGLTATYWTYSSHVDQSINMVALVALAFYLLVRLSRRGVTTRGMIVLAFVLVLASFYNFTAVLTVFAFGLAVAFMQPQLTPAQRARRLVVFLAVYGVTALVMIVLAVALFVSPSSVTDINYWREVLFAGKPEYNIQILQDTLRAILGLAKSQVVYPGVPGSLQEYWDSVSTSARLALLAYYGVILAVMAVPLVYFLVRWRKQERWLLILLPVWLALHAVFNWFWDPGFIKYWLLPLMVIWIAFALFLHDVRPTHWYRPALALTTALLVFTFVMNLTTQFLPGSREENVPWISMAETLGEESQPNDLFISVGGHPLDFHIAYFSRRNIVSTGLVAYAGEDDIGVVEEQISRHRADSGSVYLYSAEGGVNVLAEAVGVEPDQIETAWTFPNLTIYRVNYA